MPRPTSRSELLAATIEGREKLLTMLDSISSEQLVAAEDAAWSAGDVFAHLAEWERMVLSWYAAGLRGEKPAVPGEGYSWAQLPQLNDAIYRRFRDVPPETILTGWRATSAQLIELIERLSEEELFTKGRHAWTGKSSLADYIRGCGPSHYEWARKEIRKVVRPPD